MCSFHSIIQSWWTRRKKLYFFGCLSSGPFTNMFKTWVNYLHSLEEDTNKINLVAELFSEITPFCLVKISYFYSCESPAHFYNDESTYTTYFCEDITHILQRQEGYTAGVVALVKRPVVFLLPISCEEINLPLYYNYSIKVQKL